MTFDRAAIAARVRELLGDGARDLTSTAARLKVDELSLRLSVDTISPHPTVDVLAAIVRHYHVDAGWLLTGTPDHTLPKADINEAAVTALKDFVDSRMAISNEMILPEEYRIRPKEQ